MSIIDMKNHALNPSVVTYEHDTRRLRHALPHPLCHNFGLHIQLMGFVTHQQPPPLYHPILIPGCIYLRPNVGCCSLALFFFLAAHFGCVPYSAH
jgi:hypothetical protein